MIFNSRIIKALFCISFTKYSGMNRERWVYTITVIPFISIEDVNTTVPKNFYLKAKLNTS